MDGLDFNFLNVFAASMDPNEESSIGQVFDEDNNYAEEDDYLEDPLTFFSKSGDFSMYLLSEGTDDAHEDARPHRSRSFSGLSVLADGAEGEHGKVDLSAYAKMARSLQTSSRRALHPSHPSLAGPQIVRSSSMVNPCLRYSTSARQRTNFRCCM